MENLVQLIQAVNSLLFKTFYLYGMPFSFGGILIFLALGGAIIGFLFDIFHS